MWDEKNVRRAIELHKSGKNNCQIAREMLISRGTIKDWISAYKRSGNENIRKNRVDGTAKLCNYLNNILNKQYVGGSNEEEKAYTYIFGLYLGDGYINKLKRTQKLRIFQFSEYRRLINECAKALKILFPNNKVRCAKDRRYRCVNIIVHNNFLPNVFPQHGLGRKHNRKIVLEDWQKTVVSRWPKEFVRGLIDSDGCKFYAKDKKSGTKYLRFQFTNKSEDIKDLFCWACDLLGIKYNRRIGYKNVSVQTKDAVQAMDKFVPFKS